MGLLPVAQLAVGLVNIGVGVYNARQIGLVREQVSGVQAEVEHLARATDLHFQSIHMTLYAQAAALDALQRGQVELVDVIERVGEDIRTEFEADRAREYMERLGLLERAYRTFIRAPGIADEAHRLKEVAAQVTSYAEAWLSSLPDGDAQRLAWNVARTLATRATADAYLALAQTTRPEYQQLAAQELTDTIGELRSDAERFIARHSIYELTQPYAMVLPSYAHLIRGLQHGQTEGDFRSLPSTDLGAGFERLSAIRETLLPERNQKPAPALPLKTIADYELFFRWSSEDRDTLNIHRVIQIPRDEIAERYAIPLDAPLCEASLRGLAGLEPTFLEDLSRELATDLGANPTQIGVLAPRSTPTARPQHHASDAHPPPGPSRNDRHVRQQPSGYVQNLLEALGGTANIVSVARFSKDVLVRVNDPSRVDSNHLRSMGLRPSKDEAVVRLPVRDSAALQAELKKALQAST